jgi:hypothetical protein
MQGGGLNYTVTAMAGAWPKLPQLARSFVNLNAEIKGKFPGQQFLRLIIPLFALLAKTASSAPSS